VGAQVLEEVVVRDRPGRGLPRRGPGHGLEGERRAVRGRCGDADERPLLERDDLAHRLRRREVDRLERRPVGGGPQYPAVEHPRAGDVGREAVGAGDQVTRVRPRHGPAEGPPASDRSERHVRADRLAERRRDVRGLREVGVRHRRSPGARDRAPPDLERRRLDLPLPRGEGHQQLAGGGRGPAHLGYVDRRRAAAGGDAVVGDEVGVGHDQPHPVHRHPQLLGRGLDELRPGALSFLHLPAQRRDRAVLVQEEPRGDPRPRALAPGIGGGHRDEEAGAQDLEERAPIDGGREIIHGARPA
jgi:hypothetical protein